MNRRLLPSILLVFALLSAPAQAAPGDLDAWDDDGRQYVDFSSDTDFANDVVVRGNGKIIVVGSAIRTDTNISDFALVRLTPEGDIDEPFGPANNGKVTTSLTNTGDVAEAVVLQEDGRIVVVGSADSGPYTDFGIARYTPGGDPDLTFSDDGEKVTHLSDYHDRAFAVAIAPDGKIVVAGMADDDDPSDGDTGDDFALIRYRRNGRLDKTFSGDGIRTTDFGASFEQIDGVVVQPDGRIVVAGRSSGAGDDVDFALARYRMKGGLDPTFSNDGKKLTDFGAQKHDSTTALVRQADGKLIAAGTTHPIDQSDEDYGFARYRNNGSLDPDFGNGGLATVDVTNDETVADIALQKDGKIVFAGTDNFLTGDFAAGRLRRGGSPDDSWGGDGVVTTVMGTDSSVATGIAIDPDDKVVVVGETYNGAAPEYDFGIARYRSGL